MAAILEATAQVLESHGWQGATTGRIAERAGVSVGSLYQYFPSKDAIVTELVERHMTFLYQGILDAVERSAGASTEEAVTAIAAAIFDLHRDKALRHRVFLQLIIRMEGLEALDRVQVKLEEAVRARLEERIDSLRIDDPALAAAVLCRSVAGLVRTTLRQEPSKFGDPAFQRELGMLVYRYLV